MINHRFHNWKLSFVTKVVYCVLLMILFHDNKAYCQDMRFTQYYSNSLYLNPAFAGSGSETYRLSVNYRDQWRGAVDNTLRTFSFAGDTKFQLGHDKKSSDYIGFGFLFFSDRVSLFDLNTNQASIIGSFRKSLSNRNVEFLSMGFQIGLTQKSINYEDLNFPDEFNAVNGFTRPSGEILPQNNLAFADLSIGIIYTKALNGNNYLQAGVAYNHITSPDISFYKQEDIPDPNLVKENILPPKLALHVSTRFGLQHKFEVNPRILFLFQGKFKEINFGNNFRFMLDDQGERYFSVGPGLRVINGVDGTKIESIYASVGMELSGLNIGFSYDHSLSDLLNDRVGLSSLELSITYIGEYSNELNFCPTF